MPLGTHSVVVSVKNSKPQGRCLRFTQVPGRQGAGNPFRMHRAHEDRRWTLEVCIPPGLAVQDVRRGGKSSRTVRGSEQAMAPIFVLLRGCEAGRTLTVSIDNHTPGDTLSRENFISRRQQRLPT